MKASNLHMKRSIALVLMFLLSFGNVFAAAPSQFTTGTEDNTKTFFFANGNSITISERPDGEAGALITWGESGEALVPANATIFGGAHDDDTPMSTDITMEGGTVNAIFGGGLHRSNVSEAYIEIKAGTINFQVCGGGASSFTQQCGCENATWYAGDPADSPCKVMKSTIIVEDGAVFNGQTTNGYSLLFGGGEGISYTKEAIININGGEFVDTYVTAGGSNGYTGNATLNIASGDFKGVVQGINRGTMDEINMNISGGTFNNLYIGGETADSGVTGTYEKATAVISGDNIKITNLLPGSNGNSIADDASKVEITLGSNVLPDNMTTKELAESLFGISGDYAAFEVISVTLDKENITLVEGNTEDLEATVEAGSGVEDLSVIWESSDEEIVTVEDGTVKAISEGEATIFAKSLVDESIVDSCLIRVIVKSDAKVRYRITVGQNEGGTISPETVKVGKGNDKVFTITADEGYEIEDVIVDGESVGAVSEYRFENVREAHFITAKFKNLNEEEKWVNPFDDVLEDAWYFEAVKFVNENRLFNGMEEDMFGADIGMTRGMAVTVIYRLDGAEYEGTESFDDVAEDSYYANAIAWAYGEEIVNGIGDNKFAPDREITREEFVTMLYRYVKLIGEDEEVDMELEKYEDTANIDETAIDAFKWAVKNEIVKGISDTQLAPNKLVTRAEVAVMMERLMSK